MKKETMKKETKITGAPVPIIFEDTYSFHGIEAFEASNIDKFMARLLPINEGYLAPLLKWLSERGIGHTVDPFEKGKVQVIISKAFAPKTSLGDALSDGENSGSSIADSNFHYALKYLALLRDACFAEGGFSVSMGKFYQKEMVHAALARTGLDVHTCGDSAVFYFGANSPHGFFTKM